MLRTQSVSYQAQAQAQMNTMPSYGGASAAAAAAAAQPVAYPPASQGIAISQHALHSANQHDVAAHPNNQNSLYSSDGMARNRRAAWGQCAIKVKDYRKQIDSTRAVSAVEWQHLTILIISNAPVGDQVKSDATAYFQANLDPLWAEFSAAWGQKLQEKARLEQIEEQRRAHQYEVDQIIAERERSNASIDDYRAARERFEELQRRNPAADLDKYQWC